MATLAWYYSRKVYNTKDMVLMSSDDIVDVNEFHGHLGFDFVDGSRLVFDLSNNESEIIEMELDAEQREAIANFTRSKSC